MAALGLRITRDDISPAHTRLAGTARNPTPVLRAMGTTFMSLTMGTFNSVGADYRPKPWAPKYDGSPSNLILHGVLSKAFHLTVTSTHATVSNPMIYAAIHQFGGIIHGNPFLKFKAGGKLIITRQVKMPARPFFPVLDGKLTQKAEEKIAAAAQRVILSQAEGK